MTTATRKPKLPTCEYCPGVTLEETQVKYGRRPILKCPKCQCQRVKPPRTPKREWELTLTEVPLSEFKMQCRLFEEAKAKRRDWPELELLHSIPNGAFVPPGERGKLAGSGMLPGVPDTHLPVPRGPYASLYIELKVPGEKPSKAQQDVHRALRDQGNRVETFDNWKDALNCLLQYLAGEIPCTSR